MSLESFANTYLFAPMDIAHVTWAFRPDRSSAETFGQLSLRPRDMLKMGLMFQNQGRWGGRQVVPAAWVAASTSTRSSVDETDYGYLWWRPYLNVPGGRHDAIMATGNGGQKLYIWPELNLVVVMTGGNYNANSPSNALLIRHILPPRQAGTP
jgi:CubicO group peptidase (beta-lactamase class C family)